ncbi:MAG: ATP-binding cassette domain-containing protein [Deltaproteobacteria bacterium]|nr:ATP-binding cassette domain-containing protein [Deltaproteobacteria bacterium]
MIRLEDVHKAFDEPLLSGIDLAIARGTIWGLVGPAASGKSVLLKLICGLVRPDHGRILVGEDDLTTLEEHELMRPRRRIGMLFQNNALFDFMNVQDNVAFPLVRAGVAPEEALARAAARLKAVGLAGSELKLPSQLSGGMKKRVAVARASVSDPEIVIYDEPTAGLDPVTTSKIYELLAADHARSGATVVVVSSDVDALRSFAGEMALLYQGRLRYNGPSASIEESPDPVVRQFVRGDLEGPL